MGIDIHNLPTLYYFLASTFRTDTYGTLHVCPDIRKACADHFGILVKLRTANLIMILCFAFTANIIYGTCFHFIFSFASMKNKRRY